MFSRKLQVADEIKAQVGKLKPFYWVSRIEKFDKNIVNSTFLLKIS